MQTKQIYLMTPNFRTIKNTLQSCILTKKERKKERKPLDITGKLPQALDISSIILLLQTAMYFSCNEYRQNGEII